MLSGLGTPRHVLLAVPRGLRFRVRVRVSGSVRVRVKV